MTPIEKQLLLQDLCARLPYKVCAVQYYSGFEDNFIIEGIIGEQIYAAYNLKISMTYPVEKIKPYLRPMSSMTEDERKELSNLVNNELNGNQEDDDCLPWVLYDSTGIKNQTGGERFYFNEMSIIYDWFNEHHFDYRSLIEKGLALPAPDGMYKTN